MERLSLKSGGVTSDTNQGINFGLGRVRGVNNEPHKRDNHLLEYNFGNEWRVRHKEVSENEVRKQLQILDIQQKETSRIRNYLKSS